MTLQRICRFAWLRAGLTGCGVAVAALAVASCSSQATGPAGLVVGKSTVVSPGPTGTAGGQGHSGRTGHRARGDRIRVVAARDPFGACEERIGHGPHGIRSMAIVGASYTAGVGPGIPALSWAADFARQLHWNAVIYGVPGAGYLRTGDGRLGPMTRMLEAERLPDLAPSLVIVQAGHDDEGVTAQVERRQVLRTIDLIRVEVPRARIALLTVFSLLSGRISPADYRTDRAIVTAARDADPHVIIMDPLTGHWNFQHARDRLHPTAAGDAWIARKVASILGDHGIAVSRPTLTRAVMCDLSVRGKAAVLPKRDRASPTAASRWPVDRRTVQIPDRTRQRRAPGT